MANADLTAIVSEMRETGVDADFATMVGELALVERNFSNLLLLWHEIVDARGEILADIRRAVEEYQGAPTGPVTLPSREA